MATLLEKGNMQTTPLHVDHPVPLSGSVHTVIWITKQTQTQTVAPSYTPGSRIYIQLVCQIETGSDGLFKVLTYN